MSETLVVNFYGGPGAGKTTAAMETTVELKKRGIDAEYVPEYAKELVRRGEILTLQDQRAVTGEQIARIKCLLGACEVIVTDSPIMLGEVYAIGKNLPESYGMELYSEYASMRNMDVFVMRRGAYDDRGRIEFEDEAKKRDRQIIEMMIRHKIPIIYHTAGERLDKIVAKIEKLSDQNRAKKDGAVKG